MRLWNDFTDSSRAARWAALVAELGYRVSIYCPFDSPKPSGAEAGAWTVEVDPPAVAS